MTAIEIARQLAALNQTEGAIKAYGLAIHQAQDPAEQLEAALYILQNGGDYKGSYSTPLSLFRRGEFRGGCPSLMTPAVF